MWDPLVNLYWTIAGKDREEGERELKKKIYKEGRDEFHERLKDYVKKRDAASGGARRRRAIRTKYGSSNRRHRA